VGLSGDDGGLFQVRKALAGGELDIGFVGEIVRVDTDVLQRVAENYIPVIASVGADLQGHSYNVNADEAAAAVAKALGAEKLIFLTDVPGWLADPADESSRISQATAAQVRERLETLSGGMRPKLAACADVVEHGVGAAHIVDGRERHAVLLELFTNEGIGTKVVA
jgi:acetylglutamate kinase